MNIDSSQHRSTKSVKEILTLSGITAGINAGLAFLAITYVAPGDYKANPSLQEVSAHGDAVVIPGFDKGKALEYAHSVALGLGILLGFGSD